MMMNLKIYNTTGKEVIRFSENNPNLGENLKIINCEILESGVYFIKMFINNKVFVEKIIIFK